MYQTPPELPSNYVEGNFILFYFLVYIKVNYCYLSYIGMAMGRVRAGFFHTWTRPAGLS